MYLTVAENTDYFSVFIQYRPAAVSRVCSHRDLAGQRITAETRFRTQITFTIYDLIPRIAQRENGFTQFNIAFLME